MLHQGERRFPKEGFFSLGMSTPIIASVSNGVRFKQGGICTLDDKTTFLSDF